MSKMKKWGRGVKERINKNDEKNTNKNFKPLEHIYKETQKGY